MSARLMAGVRHEWMKEEGRVPLFPETVDRLRSDLARLGIMLGFVVESGVGEKVGLTDRDWRKVGSVTGRPKIFYEEVDVVLGVKQPSWDEVARLGERPAVQGICCFLHASANQEITQRLLEKEKVKILPLERSHKSLGAMSRAVGLRIARILDRCYGGRGDKKNWREENILVTGARGTVGRHCIDNLLLAGVNSKRIFACDIVEGEFVTKDTAVPRHYTTFSSADEDEFMAALQVCGIEIIAAFSGKGGAPKIHEYRHLAIKPHRALVIQVNIDEGGSIKDERFCQVTFWDNPVYEVILGPKKLCVCNVPDIPGCIDPLTSSRALEEANYDYYLRLFSTWPDVPEEYLFKGF